MPDQYRLYRREDGKRYEPVLATQSETYAVRWAIEYSLHGPSNVVWSVWRQSHEYCWSLNKVRKPAGVQVSADHRGKG